MKILVGYDGSEGSKKALEKAKNLISTCDVSSITMVHVEQHSAIEYAPYGGVVKMGDMESTAEDVFGEDFKEMQIAAKTIENSDVELKIIEGNDPAQVLSDYAKEKEFDLIVVGARGITGLNKWKPGSVSKAIVDNCCTSVMVVK